MGRPPLAAKQKQLPVALPAETRALLETAAAAAGHSLAEEVRGRLKWTTDLEPLDVPTRELIEAIASIAQDIESETGASWHSHAGSHAAFRQAILSHLARAKPEGSTDFGARPNRTVAYDDPREIGIWIEHGVWQTSGWTREAREKLRAESAKVFQEILKGQEEQS
jgi:hypothetical protein